MEIDMEEANIDVEGSSDPYATVGAVVSQFPGGIDSNSLGEEEEPITNLAVASMENTRHEDISLGLGEEEVHLWYLRPFVLTQYLC